MVLDIPFVLVLAPAWLYGLDLTAPTLWEVPWEFVDLQFE